MKVWKHTQTTILVGVTLAGTLWLNGCGRSSALMESQAQFFPKQTYCLMQVLNDKPASRTLLLKAFAGLFPAATLHQPSAAEPQSAPHKPTTETSPAGKPSTATPTLAEFVVSHLGHQWEPHYSLGMLAFASPSADTPSSPVKSLPAAPLAGFHPQLAKAALREQSHGFLVLTLKDKNASLKTLQQEMNTARVANTTLDTVSGLSVLRDTTHGLLWARVDNTLWVTDSEQVLGAALALKTKPQEALIADETLQKTLRHVDRNSDAAFVIHTRPLLLLPDSSATAPDHSPAIASLPEPARQAAAQVRRLFGDLIPFTVGSFRFENETGVNGQLYTPVQLAALAGSGQADALKTVLATPTPLLADQQVPADANLMISLGGLDRLLNYQMDHGFAASERAKLEGFERLMQFLGIDLRQDVFRLLAGETVLAAQVPDSVLRASATRMRSSSQAPSAGPASPDLLRPSQASSFYLLLSHSAEKQETLDKLLQLLGRSMKGQGVEKETLAGDTEAWMLKLPSPRPSLQASPGGNDVGLAAIGPYLWVTSPTVLQAVASHTQPVLAAQKEYQTLAQGFPKDGLFKLYVQGYGQDDQAQWYQSRSLLHFAALDGEGGVPGSFRVRWQPHTTTTENTP
ncbi:MAG: DUF3352 domain-containing protein [Candidatus Melainabacteria bacterium]|nr:DUF3352 domain-containing protein [Candidatus Melainabacteria bacterium]